MDKKFDTFIDPVNEGIASSNEMTGMIPALPETDEAKAAYLNIYRIPKN